LTFWGRGSSSFDLSPDWSLETGVSGLVNPKTLDKGGVLALPNNTPVTLPEFPGSTLKERDRTLEGADIALNWKPLSINQFQSFTWGTEFLHSGSNFEVFPERGLPLCHYDDSYGMYSYVAYKFHRQWTVGFLYEWVENVVDHNDVTVSYSPYLTWAISHWNQLRLQYTHTDHTAESGLRPNDAIYLQWAWIIGSHSHGWQQR